MVFSSMAASVWLGLGEPLGVFQKQPKKKFAAEQVDWPAGIGAASAPINVVVSRSDLK